MTLDSQTSSSFGGISLLDIVQAKKLDELKGSCRKLLYRETWCCAWAPDNSYFAWSQGCGIVQLLPWNSTFNALLTTPNDDYTEKHSPPVISDLSWKFFNGKEHDCKLEKRRHRIDCMDVVWSMAFSFVTTGNEMKRWRRLYGQPGLLLATGLMKGKIKLWAVYTGTLLMELLDHKDVVRDLTFSPCCQQLASGSNDGTIKFWDLTNDGNMYRTLRMGPNTWVMGCKWSPNGKQLAAVGTNRSVIIWYLKKMPEKRKLSGHVHNVTACDFSPDGALLATASFDTRVILWNVSTGDIIKTLFHLHPPPRPIYAGGANDHYVRDLSFCNNGIFISTVADDGYLRMWDLRDTTNPITVAKIRSPLCCSYSANCSVVSAGTRDGNVEFYQVEGTVVPLQHLCRKVLRTRLTFNQVDGLNYPLSLKEYLKYNWI